LDFATGVGLFPLDLLAARVPSLPVARFWDIMLTVANTKHWHTLMHVRMTCYVHEEQPLLAVCSNKICVWL
jgi:hypothetical protein